MVFSALSIPKLITTGGPFKKALETAGALAVYMPLEGGYEGRFLRRLRTAGYRAVTVTARGLGDLDRYLNGTHGVRPPHLGKKNVGRESAAGPVYFIPPILSCQLGELDAKSKGVVLWIIEGQVLSTQELAYLNGLPLRDGRIKVVVEMGGARAFSWKSLSTLL